MKKLIRRLWLINRILKGILIMANTLADKIQALTDQVTATVGVEASVVTYLNGIPALIQHAIDTALTLPDLQAKLTDLQKQLADSSATVAAAVAAAPQDAPVVDPNPDPGPAIAVAPVTLTGTGTVGDGSGQA